MSKKKILTYVKDDKVRQIVDIMCHKLGYVNVMSVGSHADFNEVATGMVDHTAMSFGMPAGKSIPRLMIDLVIIEWDSPPKGFFPFLENFKSKFSGRFGIMVIADPKHERRFMMALKAGVTSYLMMPFKQAEFAEKLTIGLSRKPEAIIQGFELGGATGGAFAVQTLVDKERGSDEKKKKLAKIKEQEGRGEKKPPKETDYSKIKTTSPSKITTVTKEELMAGNTGASSFHSSTSGGVVIADEVTATLVDGKIDGHYHEKATIIGGGENCYWAEELDDGRVKLDYLSPKGKPTGTLAKIILKDQFMHSFFLCQEYGCEISRRNAT